MVPCGLVGKNLIGWESDEEDDVSDEYDWDYQPQDTSLLQRWSELDKVRAQGEDGLAMVGVLEVELD